MPRPAPGLRKIDAAQQHKFVVAEYHLCLIPSRFRPPEPALLQTFGAHPESTAVPIKQLQPVSRQPVQSFEALAHMCRSSRQIDPRRQPSPEQDQACPNTATSCRRTLALNPRFTSIWRLDRSIANSPPPIAAVGCSPPSAFEFVSRNEPAIPSLPLPDRRTHHGLTRALRTEPPEGPLRLGFDAGGSLFQNHCRSFFYFITRTALCIDGFALMLSHHPPPDRRLPLTATHLRRCRRGPATYRVRAPQPRKQTNKRIAGWAGHLILTIRCGVQAGRVLDMKYRPLPLS